MYQYNFKRGLFRIDHDWFFESRYVCFTFFNLEYDKNPLDSSICIGIIGLHLMVIWR